MVKIQKIQSPKDKDRDSKYILILFKTRIHKHQSCMDTSGQHTDISRH